MELKIQQPSFPEIIEFNFNELKEEITKKTSVYKSLVYADNQIMDAKKDVAALRKFVKALSDKRIEIKKECLKPYESFETKIKELDGIVNEAIQNIASQIKEYEEAQKEEKLEQILAIWNNSNAPEWVHPTQILDEKWLNASVSLASIEAEITARLERVAEDLAVLGNLPKFAFEAIGEYKRTLSLTTAINFANRLSEIGKEKAEIAAENKPTEESLKKRLSGEVESEPPVRHWVSFSAYMTVDEATALRIFFESRNIEFEANKQTNH